MKQSILIFSLIITLFSCKENEEQLTNVVSQSTKPTTVDVEGEWKLNYLVFNKKKLIPSKICNSTQILGIIFGKDNSKLTVPCSPTVNFTYSKIDDKKLLITPTGTTLADCKPFVLCDKNPENIDGSVFENYNRQIIQNNPNIWIASKNVVYSALKYENKVDSLIFTDDLGNKAVYFK